MTKTASVLTDHLRGVIVARAAELGLTAYALEKKCCRITDEPVPDANSIHRYFKGETSMTSQRISVLCQVLGLTLVKKEGLS